VLAGTATTVDEAVALENAEVDVVSAQGDEAGAHHGTFLHDPFAAVVGTVALVPQVRDAVRIPVIAAGGIMDGRGLAAALVLGAGAAQMGTAFLRCPEAGTSSPYRRALAEATERDTALSANITGRIARGIENRLMRVVEDLDVPPYPIMNALTSELRREAAQQGNAELLSLWSGQGVRLGTELPVRELVERTVAEARALLPVARP
jgi:nitronate monooxygenase